MSTSSEQPEPEDAANGGGNQDNCRNRANAIRCYIGTSIRNPNNIPHYLIALFTFGVAVFACYAWLESRQGTRALQGQLDELKKSFSVDRAYVFGGFEGYGTLPIEPGIAAKFWFRNYGRTPAILRTAPATRCYYSADGFHPLEVTSKLGTFTDTSGHLPEGIVIPSDKDIGPFEAKLEATNETIEKARIGVGKLYCEAAIGYDDMRGTPRDTGVCFFYNFTFSGFFLCPEKGANYHS